VSDIKLFRVRNGAVDELQGRFVAVEKSLQVLIEKHLQELLGVRFPEALDVHLDPEALLPDIPDLHTLRDLHEVVIPPRFLGVVTRGGGHQVLNTLPVVVHHDEGDAREDPYIAVLELATEEAVGLQEQVEVGGGRPLPIIDLRLLHSGGGGEDLEVHLGVEAEVFIVRFRLWICWG
jgi:hypothetical protein